MPRWERVPGGKGWRRFRADRYLVGLRPLKQVARPHRAAYVQTVTRAALAARDCGEVWHVNSSYRTYSEQVALWDAYQNGTGNLAAKPGSSMHEFGRALDLAAQSGTPIGTEPKRRRALEKRGLVFAVVGEPWHVENRA